MEQPLSRESAQRETFVALRARREAHRIASEILHPPLDPYQFYCRHCGRPLDGENLDVHDHIRCDACGLRTQLPPASAIELRRQRARRRRPARSRGVLGGVRDFVVWAYLLLAVIMLFSALQRAIGAV